MEEGVIRLRVAGWRATASRPARPTSWRYLDLLPNALVGLDVSRCRRTGPRMSVRKLGDQLCADLYARHLKNLGFRKGGRTFVRERVGYREDISIQGSSWNSGAEPWQFCVNVAITLSDVPVNIEQKYRHHAVGRLGRLVEEAPPAFNVLAGNPAIVADQLAEYISRACDAIPGTLDAIRVRAKRGLFSPLPVPATDG